MVDLLGNSGIIADDETVEAPGIPEQFIHQIRVHRCGNSLKLVEGAHIACGACKSCLLIGTQIAIQRFLAVHENGIIVTSGFCGSVKSIVFDAYHHIVIIEYTVRSLVTTNIGFGNLAAQIGIFAAAFRDTAPTGVAADIHHWAENPVDAGSGSFLRCRPGRAFNQVHIPGSGKSERYGKHRLKAVDDVHSHNEWNAGAGRNGDLLHHTEVFDVPAPEYAA